MIIIKLDNKTTLEVGLRQLKNKLFKTRQNRLLQERKEYKKKSVLRREEIKKAIFRERLSKSK
jgi:small subunit ribosomal protein S21